MITLLFFVVSSFCSGQTLVKTIGEFAKAEAFSISPGGLIYVTDIDQDELYQFDAEGKLLESIGGYGWESLAFDQPVDVYATTLRIYVADKNNNRIQIFDKFLNYLSNFSVSEDTESSYAFAYPTGFGVSNQGDYFILDSDNLRILKYDINGNFLLQIGNYDSGKFALSEPTKLAVSADGKIFVINKEQVFVFDQYGTGLIKLSPGFAPKNINITFYNLTLNSDSKIKYLNLKDITGGFKAFAPNIDEIEGEEIKEAAIFNEKIFVLTDKTIAVYKLNSNEEKN
ncbi:MAG: hypothetical protein GXO87_01820 [Chlorobi bacterium]|nr:hypothetical protein [Chlorobiota bacterium]